MKKEELKGGEEGGAGRGCVSRMGGLAVSCKPRAGEWVGGWSEASGWAGRGGRGGGPGRGGWGGGPCIDPVDSETLPHIDYFTPTPPQAPSAPPPPQLVHWPAWSSRTSSLQPPEPPGAQPHSSRTQHGYIYTSGTQWHPILVTMTCHS